MIFIDKQDAPDFLQEYVNLQQEANLQPRYADFQQKQKLRIRLAEEQEYLCCYCMNRVDPQILRIHQKEESSSIEHFLPQYPFHTKELTYSNLFLTCRRSEGESKKHQHCDVSRGNILIPDYLSHKDCASLFSYNAQGEILPANAYKNVAACVKHYAQLSSEQKMVFAAIEVLNLNESNLKDERKKFRRKLIPKINKFNKLQIQQQIAKYNAKRNGEFPRFFGVALVSSQKSGEKLNFLLSTALICLISKSSTSFTPKI